MGQKFELHTKEAFGIVPLFSAFASAGLNQAFDTPEEWEQGASGYGKRLAGALGQQTAREYFEFTLESVLHQDGRYVLSPEGSSAGYRLKNVIRQSFIVRTDSGGHQFAYAALGSRAGAAFLANTWNPPSNSRVSDAFQRIGIGLGTQMGFRAAQEFIPFLRKIRR